MFGQQRHLPLQYQVPSLAMDWKRNFFESMTLYLCSSVIYTRESTGGDFLGFAGGKTSTFPTQQQLPLFGVYIYTYVTRHGRLKNDVLRACVHRDTRFSS
jgi:hypothetical protein